MSKRASKLHIKNAVEDLIKSPALSWLSTLLGVFFAISTLFEEFFSYSLTELIAENYNLIFYAGSGVAAFLAYDGIKTIAKDTIEKRRIFLSYSARDVNHVRMIIEKLKDEGLKLWDAELEIKPGDDISVEITWAIKNSDVVLVLLSEHQSKWADIEFSIAINNNKKIIPIIISEDAKIPDELITIKHLNLTHGSDENIQTLINALNK